MIKELPGNLNRGYIILPMSSNLIDQMKLLNPNADEELRDHLKEETDQIIDDLRNKLERNSNLNRTEKIARIDRVVTEIIRIAYNRNF